MNSTLKEIGLFTALFVPICSIILIPELVGDRGYILRIVQNGGYETVYLLIGTILGFVLRDASLIEGKKALVAAITAVISGMLLGAFKSLDNLAAWMAGVFLASVFMTCLAISILLTLEALKHVHKKEASRNSDTPKFIRTPPPRSRS